MFTLSRLWGRLRASLVGTPEPPSLPRFSVCYADSVDLTEERMVGASSCLVRFGHLEDAYDWCWKNESWAEETFGPGVLCVVDLARDCRTVMLWCHAAVYEAA